MEKEYQINWLKIIGITVLIVAIVVFICLIYPKGENKLLIQQTYIHNISLMKEAGFEYFNGNRLPKDIGDSKRISLDELVARNLLPEFLDEEGNSCNTQNSYIEATKVLDNEYEMSVYLSCNNKSDYIVTTISNDIPVIDREETLEDESDQISSSSDKQESVIWPTYNPNNNYRNDGQTNITQTTNVYIDYVNSNNCGDECLTDVYHSVVFDSNGGSFVRTQTIKHGDQAIDEITYRDGYNFLGWYLNGVKYDFDTPVTAKITLVAKWKKKEIVDKPEVDKVYYVFFDSNGGSQVSHQIVKKSDVAKKPIDPVKDCYEFLGWYTDSALTKKYDFSKPVLSDITLYAKWDESSACYDTYRVRFDSNGGSLVNTQWIKEGEYLSKPEDPTRNGYEFLGWYLDGHYFDFSDRIYEDITLEARWEKIQEKYYEYCKIKSKDYNSMSYVMDNQQTWNYSWTVQFSDLDNVSNVRVKNINYLTTLSMYNDIFRGSDNGSMSMVDGDDSDNAVIYSGSTLRTYSLKPNNFTPYVSAPYYHNGVWYADLSVKIKNYYHVTAYYANNIKSWIYYVPFNFELEYTDLDQCVVDQASRSYLYDDYEIVDTYWY